MATVSYPFLVLLFAFVWVVCVDSAIFVFQWKPTNTELVDNDSQKSIGKVRINVDETFDISPLFPDGIGGTYFNSIDVLTAEVTEDTSGITCFFYTIEDFVTPLFDAETPLELPNFINAGWLFYFALPAPRRQILVLAEYGENSIQPFVVDLVMGFGYRNWPITANGIGRANSNELVGYIRGATVIASPEPDVRCYFIVDPSENDGGRNVSTYFSQDRPLQSHEFGVIGISCTSEMSYDSSYHPQNWNIENSNEDFFSNSE